MRLDMGGESERGSATAAYIAGAGLALLLFVMLANAVVVQYGVGVVRGAIDEGARAGSLLGGAESTCEEVANDVLANLLGGPFGQSIEVTCVREPAAMVARAEGAFRLWVPGLPAWNVSLSALSTLEPEG